MERTAKRLIGLTLRDDDARQMLLKHITQSGPAEDAMVTPSVRA